MMITVTPEDIAKIQNAVPEVEVHEKLGGSLLGSIYRITHPKYGECALKILEGKVTKNKKFLMRFLESAIEAKFVAHANFARIYEVKYESSNFVIREMIKGRSLAEVLTHEKQLSWQRAIELSNQAIGALNAAYELDLLHKDLKPSNIILAMDGSWKIVDFSLPPTTAHYLSPEQCQGKKSDVRSEIYSLGTILYHCLAGVPPFQAATMKEIMHRHVHAECPSLEEMDLPLDVLLALSKMLDKEPGNRYQNYQELKEGLKDLLHQTKDGEHSAETIDPAMTLEVAPDDSYLDLPADIVELEDNDAIKRVKETDRIIKKMQEKIDLTKTVGFPSIKKSSLTNLELPPEIVEGLTEATDLTPFLEERISLHKRNILFPRIFQHQVIEHLQKKFRRECWLVKDLNDKKELEVEIDIEQALILHYLYKIEDQIQSTLRGIMHDALAADTTKKMTQSGILRFLDDAIKEDIKECLPTEDNVDDNDAQRQEDVSQSEIDTDATIPEDQSQTVSDVIHGLQEDPPIDEESVIPLDIGDDMTVPEDKSQNVTRAVSTLQQKYQETEENASSLDIEGDMTVPEDQSADVGNAVSALQQKYHSMSMTGEDTAVDPSLDDIEDDMTIPEDQSADVSNAVSALQQKYQETEENASSLDIEGDMTVPEDQSADVGNAVSALQQKYHSMAMTGEDTAVDPSLDDIEDDMTIPEDQSADVSNAVSALQQKYQLADNVESEEEPPFAFESTIRLQSVVEQEMDVDATIPEDQSQTIADVVDVLQQRYQETLGEGEATVEGSVEDIDMTVAEDQSQEVTDAVGALQQQYRENLSDGEETIAFGDTVRLQTGEVDIDSTKPQDDVMDANATVPEDQSEGISEAVQTIKQKLKIIKQGIVPEAMDVSGDMTVPEDQSQDVTDAVEALQKQYSPTENGPSDIDDDMTVPEDQSQNVADAVEALQQEYLFQGDENGSSFADHATIIGSSPISQQYREYLLSQDGDDTAEDRSNQNQGDMTVPEDQSQNITDAVKALQEMLVREEVEAAEQVEQDPTLSEDRPQEIDEAVKALQEMLTRKDATDQEPDEKDSQNDSDEQETIPPTEMGKTLARISKTPTNTGLDMSTRAGGDSDKPLFNENNEGIDVLSYRNVHIDIEVDFNNHYQTMAWLQFVKEHNLKRGEHFTLKLETQDDEKKVFCLDLQWLLEYQRRQDSMSSIKAFFETDYEINELGRGGMGMVLKLTTKNDFTILTLRPENRWARRHLAPYLKVRVSDDGAETVYAEISEGMDFVVKVAPKNYEESLIREAKLLEEIAWDKKPIPHIIGVLQQGRLMNPHSAKDDPHLGYFMMLEYASQGSAEQLYTMFPEERMPISVAFTIAYSMTQALLKLKQKQIIHRDIKPDNILFNADGVAKLSDFGLSITTAQVNIELDDDRRRLLRLLDTEFLQISREREQIENRLAQLRYKLDHERDQQSAEDIRKEIAKLQEQLPKLQEQERKRAESLHDRYRVVSAEENALKGKFAGSLFYAAPEQFEATIVLTPQCDVYQLGAVLFTLLTGHRPVQGSKVKEIVEQVLFYEKKHITEIIETTAISQALGDVVYEMMRKNPDRRISIEEVHKRLDDILLKHHDELTSLPEYRDADSFDKTEEWQEYEKKIKFANVMHKKSLKILRNYLQQIPASQSKKEKDQKIGFSCPECKKNLHIRPDMAGKKGKCPRCGHFIVVQLPTTK